MCINIYGRFWWSGRDRYYDYYTDKVMGFYAQGGFQIQHNYTDGTVRIYYTEEQAIEKGITDSLNYVGLTQHFLELYGRPMTRYDICGQVAPEEPPIEPPYEPPTEPPIDDEPPYDNGEKTMIAQIKEFLINYGIYIAVVIIIIFLVLR